jgi:hypothetical protein
LDLKELRNKFNRDEEFWNNIKLIC